MLPSQYRLAGVIGFLWIVASAHLGAVAAISDDGPPQARMPLMKQAPKIDGVIHEAEWQDAVRNEGFVDLSSRVKSPRRGRFWVGADKTNLYVAVKTEAPHSILAKATPQGNGDVRQALDDDTIELVIDPKRGRAGGDRTFYHMIFNANGALYDRAVNPDDSGNPIQLFWRIENWTLKNGIHDKWWHVEIAIPFSSLGVVADDLKHPWGIQIARNWQRPARQSQWSSSVHAYIDQASMPVVTWDSKAPVVQVLSLFDKPEQSQVTVSIRNPHDHPLTVLSYLSDAWHSDQPKESEERVTLKPGQTRTVNVSAVDHGEAGNHRTRIRVTSEDGGKVYYDRHYDWTPHLRGAKPWRIQAEDKQDLAFKFKYYPYHNKIRLRVDLRGAAFRKDIEQVVAEIRGLDRLGDVQKLTLWQKTLAFEKFVSEDIYDVPDFNDGKYRLFLRPVLKDGKEVAVATEDFTRIHFDWERNQLGISDRVMPPFTPLQVRDTTVHSVLREHTHGSSGLWSQVVSQGEPLLAAPMRWEVEASGANQASRRQAVVSESWRLVSRKPTQVIGQAKWSAGPLRADVQTTYDYDGMMLVTLKLEPTGESEVHRLSLSIPIDDAQAPFMHAVADGLRHHYSGRVPAGDGKVWDSTKANRIELVGTFYPYLWVGDGERGLCWFADTDKDWVLDDTTPVIELVRTDGQLLMRINLITKPSVLERQHEIVFGLQATPTKPMPEGWRRWVGNRRTPGGRTVSWIGMAYYWGAASYDVVPLSNRFEIYDEFARLRRGGKPNPTYVDQWMTHVQQIADKDSRYYKMIKRHITAGYGMLGHHDWDQGGRLFVYTNARGSGFRVAEFETFQDEWMRFDWFHRRWRGGATLYDVSPSESYVDYAVWSYQRMLTCFDGVYWDNIYPSAHFDPVVGSAWKDEKGVMHPGLGLMHLRNLIKRTAVMHWLASERDGIAPSRLPFIQLSHMTNTMVAPILSFGNCNMDWEWRYGWKNFQDRVSSDQAITQTLGRQVGAWGTILPDHWPAKDPRTPWMKRNRLGVCLVHEIHHFDFQSKIDQEIYAKLFEFGYGDPDCRVFNYWQKDHPVSVSSQSLDAKTLVIAKPGRVLIVVTDYGEGGSGVVDLNMKALSLKPSATAVDFETGDAVPLVGAGRFKISLAKHDFQILKIE